MRQDTRQSRRWNLLLKSTTVHGILGLELKPSPQKETFHFLNSQRKQSEKKKTTCGDPVGGVTYLDLEPGWVPCTTGPFHLEWQKPQGAISRQVEGAGLGREGRLGCPALPRSLHIFSEKGSQQQDQSVPSE